MAYCGWVWCRFPSLLWVFFFPFFIPVWSVFPFSFTLQLTKGSIISWCSRCKKLWSGSECHCNSNLIHCFNGLNNNNHIKTLTLIKKKRTSFKTQLFQEKNVKCMLQLCQFPNQEEHWPYDIAGGILPKLPNYQPVILRFTFFPFFGW